MSLFESLGNKKPNAQRTAQDALAQLKANPQAALEEAGLSIPDGMTDPQQMVRHLITSGQVGNPLVRQLMQMAGRK